VGAGEDGKGSNHYSTSVNTSNPLFFRIAFFVKASLYIDNYVVWKLQDVTHLFPIINQSLFLLLWLNIKILLLLHTYYTQALITLWINLSEG
jgi:hypothetical protein